MCDWGTYELVEVTVPAHLSATGRDAQKLKPIDSCIAELVRVLNAGGFQTIASCCGHGRRPGVVSLRDGRELFIMPDYESSRRLDRHLGSIWQQPRG